MIDNVQAVGALAAISSVVSFLPQAWKVIKTRDVKGLSPLMYLFTVSAFALWMTFGLLKGEWALIVPNALCLVAASFILVMVLLPRRSREQVADKLDPSDR